MRMDGITAKDQQAMVKKVLETIAGPLAPIVYRTFMSPWPWAPFFTALFTPFFFKFLVGFSNRVCYHEPSRVVAVVCPTSAYRGHDDLIVAGHHMY